MKAENILIIIRQAPFSSSLPDAALDIVLTAAAFEQKVALLFMGDGVLHLLDKQDAGKSSMKNISKALPSLELYDVELVYCEEAAFIDKNIKTEELVYQPEFLSLTQIAIFMEEADQVFNF
jgi:tRNA 2-thiouridine synthesizing protein C